MLRKPAAWPSSLALLLLTTSIARADDPVPVPVPEPPAASPPVQPAPGPSPAADPGATLKLTPLGYVEAFYSWNFNRPSNGLTNYRAFDDRHDSFTLSNVALGASWEYGEVTGKIVLQVGHTPNLYYAGEPFSAGAGGAGPSDGNTWKYLQEANIGWKAPVGRGLLLQMGLFLSPIGPETIPVKDNWNWSRSNLFYTLPYYHAGIRATYDLGAGWAATAGAYNGWNNVVDNNEDKSVSANVNYKKGILSAQALYFGGVERSTGAAEGPYWRHDFDAYAQIDATPSLSFLASVNAGLEPSRFGTSDWYGAAIYGRFKAASWLYLAARGDTFYSDAGSNASGTASPIFWPAKRVTSATATLDARPHDGISIRLEYRHDQADTELYFRGTVTGDGAVLPYVPNARSQDTLTMGATAWF